MSGRHPYCPKVPRQGCEVGAARLLRANEASLKLCIAIRAATDDATRDELKDRYAAQAALYPSHCRACKYLNSTNGRLAVPVDLTCPS